MTTACARPGCSGTIEDGFCTICGMAPAATPAVPPESSSGSRSESLTTPGTSAGSLSVRSARTGSTGIGSSRTGSSRSTGRTRRGRLGAGLVEVPPVPSVDPAVAVLADPEVAERKRFCSHCGQPVGRGRDGRPGRTEGFCRNCGTAYSFTPKLIKGDLVAGQYEVLGCLAHGGLGWI